MSEAWEWVVAASKASVEALTERVAKLEVGRAELHDRCDGLSDAIGSLEAYVSKNGVLCDAAPLASGQLASAGEADGPYTMTIEVCPHGCSEPSGCDICTPELRDEPPAEQPSRQETGGVAGGACADYCGRCGAGDHDAPACIDRAKAKAAEQAMATLAKERDAATLAMLREMPAEPSGNPGELAAEPSGAGQVPNAPGQPTSTAGTLSARLRSYSGAAALPHWQTEIAKLADEVADLEARLAQAELFLTVKDKVVAGFEERCKEADKKVAQVEQQSAQTALATWAERIAGAVTMTDFDALAKLGKAEGAPKAVSVLIAKAGKVKGFVGRYKGQDVTVTEYHPLTFYAYPEMRQDVERAVCELAAFVAKHLPDRVTP